MFIGKYGIDLQFSDFSPADHHWHDPFAYSEGDLLYDRRIDLDVILGLIRDRRWDSDCPFGYAVVEEGAGIRNIMFCRGAESYEDAFDRLCEAIENRGALEPDMFRCLSCGAEFPVTEARYVTVYEDWGDVSCMECPNCGAVEHEGEILFEGI